jgi:hypothetical protein
MSSADGSKASVTTNTPSVITSFARRPLTTTFSRSADCDGIYLSGFLAMIDVHSTCLPRNFKTDAYYSPGLICPAGYVSACHDATGVASITTVTCCPTLKNPDLTLGCVTTSTLRESWSTLYCTWVAPPSSDSTLPVTRVVNGVTTTSNLGFHSPGGLNAFGIRMVYEATDLTTQGTATTSSSRSSDTTTSKPPQDTQDSGLSTGAKVAIGVVVPVVVLAALLGALFYWRRRKPRYEAPPLVDDKPPSQPNVELPGTQIHELMDHSQSTGAPAELPGSNPSNQAAPGKSLTSRWA